MTWIIENEAFANGDILLSSLNKLNKKVILWNDSFWQTAEYKNFPKNSLFHGSLGNASRLCKCNLPNIISLCDEERFSSSYLQNNYTKYLLNQNPIFTTISELMDKPSLLDCLKTQKIFARPNSPLKEFSGRILNKGNLSPASFDYGFYHSDMNLPIVLCEYKKIEAEWRFVCVNNSIVTGCKYEAESRKGINSTECHENDPAFLFAQKIADEKKQKDFAYIIDVCCADKKLWLVEMNPFSGADLYLCNTEKIIQSIENF